MKNEGEVGVFFEGNLQHVLERVEVVETGSMIDSVDKFSIVYVEEATVVGLCDHGVAEEGVECSDVGDDKVISRFFLLSLSWNRFIGCFMKESLKLKVREE